MWISGYSASPPTHGWQPGLTHAERRAQGVDRSARHPTTAGRGALGPRQCTAHRHALLRVGGSSAGREEGTEGRGARDPATHLHFRVNPGSIYGPYPSLFYCSRVNREGRIFPPWYYYLVGPRLRRAGRRGHGGARRVLVVNIS